MKFEEKKIEYTINTKVHGVIKFSNFVLWRNRLLEKEISNPKIEKSEKLALAIAKFNIYEIEGKKYDISDDGKKLKNLKLSLSTDELKEFSQKFLDNNSYLLDSEHNEKLKQNDLPSDPIEKLKKVWCFYIEYQKEWIKKNLGLLGVNGIQGIFSAISNQAKVFSDIANYIKPTDSHIEDTISKITQHQIAQNEFQKKLDLSILSIPELINNLMKLQKDIYNSTTENQKVANQILESQLNVTKKSSNNATGFSIAAIIIAISSILISSIFGILQISNSNKPNKQIEILINKIDISNNKLNSIDSKVEEIKKDNISSKILKELENIQNIIKEENKKK